MGGNGGAATAKRDKQSALSKTMSGHSGPRIPKPATLGGETWTAAAAVLAPSFMDYDKGYESVPEEMDMIVEAIAPLMQTIVQKNNTGIRTTKGVVIKAPGTAEVEIIRDEKRSMIVVKAPNSVSVSCVSNGHTWDTMITKTTTRSPRKFSGLLVRVLIKNIEYEVTH